MSDIFREVDEDVRRDEALKFWEKYQNYFIVLAAIIALGSGGYRLYDNWRLGQAQAAGATYQAALTLARDNKGVEAEAALSELAANSTVGYRTLAALRLAGERGKRDPAAGAKAFDQLAAQSSLDPLLRQLARIRAAMLVADTASLADLSARVAPLAAAGEPFRHSARELLGLAALKANDLAAAGKWLDQIATDTEAPAPLRDRALALLSLVQAGTANAATEAGAAPAK